MSLAKRVDVEPLKLGGVVTVLIDRREYPGVVMTQVVGARGQLMSFSAKVVGSGLAPVRRKGSDEGQTWKRVSQ